MTLAQPTDDRLRVTIPQPAAEVVAFFLFSAVGGGVALFGPWKLDGPCVFGLVGFLLLIAGWSAYAIGCSEHYAFCRRSLAYEVERRSPLGTSRSIGQLDAVTKVVLETGGPDSDRRLVVLYESQKSLLTMPKRVNTLSEEDQAALGRTLAGFLGVPLRKE